MNTKYKVICADPAWGAYTNFSKAKHGAPQYEKMPTQAICDIPVNDWADKNCLLALWGTWPLLPDAMKVMEAWGFSYITGLPWIKTVPSSGNIRCGTGFWIQSTSEFLLLGRKGKVSPSKENKRRGLLVGSDRIFYGPVKGHSTKPEDIQTWLENRFSGPYLELFARRKKPGWSCWGLDTGYRLSKAGVQTL
jgi:N6-adenosine-specific RNA methylase IME4